MPRRIFLGSFSLLFIVVSFLSFFLGGGVSSSGLRRGSFERLSRSAHCFFFSDYSLSLYLYFLFSVLTASAVSPLAPAPTAIGTDIHNRYKKA